MNMLEIGKDKRMISSDGFMKDGINLRFTGGDPQDITFSNSSILGSNTHSIYANSSSKSINLFSPEILFSDAFAPAIVLAALAFGSAGVVIIFCC